MEGNGLFPGVRPHPVVQAHTLRCQLCAEAHGFPKYLCIPISRLFKHGGGQLARGAKHVKAASWDDGSKTTCRSCDC